MVQADFDILFSHIKTALEEYSAGQEKANRFGVNPDYFRALPTHGIANVFLYVGSMNPDEESAGHCEYETDYIFELVAWGKRSSGCRAEEAAGARLRYLIHQVLNALYDPENMNFGLPVGVFARTGYPRIVPLDVPPHGAERVAAAARMTWTLRTAWEPSEQPGVPIDSIAVTADKWSVLFDLRKEE